jgi:hypothetical protein
MPSCLVADENAKVGHFVLAIDVSIHVTDVAQPALLLDDGPEAMRGTRKGLPVAAAGLEGMKAAALGTVSHHFRIVEPCDVLLGQKLLGERNDMEPTGRDFRGFVHGRSTSPRARRLVLSSFNNR